MSLLASQGQHSCQAGPVAFKHLRECAESRRQAPTASAETSRHFVTGASTSIRRPAAYRNPGFSARPRKVVDIVHSKPPQECFGAVSAESRRHESLASSVACL